MLTQQDMNGQRGLLEAVSTHVIYLEAHPEGKRETDSLSNHNPDEDPGTSHEMLLDGLPAHQQGCERRESNSVGRWFQLSCREPI